MTGHEPARFTHLQRASRSQRLTALILGPVLWLIGILVVGFVLNRRGSIEVSLMVTAIAFAFSLPICWFARSRRVREERRAEQT